MTIREKYLVHLFEAVFDLPVHILEYPFTLYSDFHMELREILLERPFPPLEELQKEILEVPSNRIFYLKSALGYVNIFFRFPEPQQSKFFYIGPFLEEVFSPAYLSRIARKEDLSEQQTKWLHSYFSSLPVISEQRILRVLSLVLSQEVPGFTENEIIFYNFQPFQPLNLQKFITNEEKFAVEYHDNLLETHKNFFHAFRLGNFSTVFSLLPRYLSESFSIQNVSVYAYKRMLHDLNTECRMCLFATPISPYHTHQTWKKCSLKIQTEMSQERIQELAEWMIKEYSILYKRFGYKNYSPIIRNMIDYVHHHLSEPLSLQKVAEHFNRNSSTLSRQFKEETGENFSQYINRIKIASILDKVLQAKESLQDIALSIGFDEQAYFNRVFYQQMGCSPSQYRVNWYSSKKEK